MSKHIILLCIVCLFLIVGVFLLVNNYGFFFSLKPTSKVIIDNKTFFVLLAKTEEEKTTGLSTRSSLPQDEGMLFLFPSSDYYAFWMKDMRFNLDIIYINGTKVVSIISNIPYLKTTSTAMLPVYKPTFPADKVLEINAGLSQRYHIHVGDTISFTL